MRLNSSVSVTFHSLHVCINVFKVEAKWVSTSSRCVSVSERNATATAMGIVCCRLGCNSCVMPFVGVESRNDDDDDDDDDDGGGDGSDDDEDDDNGFCGGGIDLHDVDEHDDDVFFGGGGDGFCGGGKDDDGDEDGGGSCGKDDDDDDDEEEEEEDDDDDDDALRFDNDDDEDDVVPPYLIVLLMVDGRTMIFLSEGSKFSVQSFRHLSICCRFLSVTLLSCPAFFKMEWIKALFSSVFTASIF